MKACSISFFQSIVILFHNLPKTCVINTFALALLLSIYSAMSSRMVQAAPIGFEFSGRMSQTGPGTVFVGHIGITMVGRIIFDPDQVQNSIVLTSTARSHLFPIPTSEFSIFAELSNNNIVTLNAGEYQDSVNEFEIRLFNSPASASDLFEIRAFNANPLRDSNNIPAPTRLSLVLGGSRSVDSIDVPGTIPDFSRFSSASVLAHAVDPIDGHLSHIFTIDMLSFSAIDPNMSGGPGGGSSTVPEPSTFLLSFVGLLGFGLLRAYGRKRFGGGDCP